jgi:ABC-type branched-subunit amino acid transport system ATPase component
MSAVLQIEGLHCFRGHSHVLQGVDLELSEGVTGLVGRNGMGKSTLAESVMGLLRPRGGSVRLICSWFVSSGVVKRSSRLVVGTSASSCSWFLRRLGVSWRRVVEADMRGLVTA